MTNFFGANKGPEQPPKTPKYYSADKIRENERKMRPSILQYEKKEEMPPFDPTKQEENQETMIAKGQAPIDAFSPHARQTEPKSSNPKKERKPKKSPRCTRDEGRLGKRFFSERDFLWFSQVYS